MLEQQGYGEYAGNVPFLFWRFTWKRNAWFFVGEILKFFTWLDCAENMDSIKCKNQPSGI